MSNSQVGAPQLVKVLGGRYKGKEHGRAREGNKRSYAEEWGELDGERGGNDEGIRLAHFARSVMASCFTNGFRMFLPNWISTEARCGVLMEGEWQEGEEMA